MPEWGLLWNGMNGGDLDGGKRAGGDLTSVITFPPYSHMFRSLGRTRAKCAHAGVEPTDTRRDVLRLL